MRGVKAACRSWSRISEMSGLSRTGNNGFGRNSEKGLSLVPRPAARIMAFIIMPTRDRIDNSIRQFATGLFFYADNHDSGLIGLTDNILPVK